MILRRYQKEEKPKEGDIKRVYRYAWWPKRVGDELIWLEEYVEIFKYKDIIDGWWEFVRFERIGYGVPKMDNPPPTPRRRNDGKEL